MENEGKITWTPDMSVGIDSLDEDHKVLIVCLNEYIDACDHKDSVTILNNIFNVLLDYTGYHFRREEKVLEACGYPGLEAHKELHVTLTQKVIDSRNSHMSNPGNTLSDEVREFLQSWLQDHILSCDMDYVASCSGKEQAIAAALEQEALPLSSQI